MLKGEHYECFWKRLSRMSYFFTSSYDKKIIHWKVTVRSKFKIWIWTYSRTSRTLSQTERDMSKAFKWFRATSSNTKQATNFCRATNSFHIALEVTLHYNCKTCTCWINTVLVLLLVKCCDILHHLCCIRLAYCKTLFQWIPIFYYILNIKMTPKSLSNFCRKLRASKFW